MYKMLVISTVLTILLTGCASRTVGAVSVPISEGKTIITSPKTEQPVEEKAADPIPETEQAPTDALPAVDDDWRLILVNDRNALTEDFAPELEEVQSPYKMDRRAAPMLRQMIADAQSQGVSLMLCSAYRPYSSQQRNFEASVARYIQQGYSREQAESATLRLIAAPGNSEHQTGLAADIVTPSYQGLDSGYEQTEAARWLKANAASYGFILRYPKDKTEITHIEFEPWHYRYVGEEAAKIIMEKGICLEEYLGHAEA